MNPADHLLEVVNDDFRDKETVDKVLNAWASRTTTGGPGFNDTTGWCGWGFSRCGDHGVQVEWRV